VNISKGDRLMRIGSILLVIGMLFTAVAILPLFTDLELPSIWWGLSMIAGVGLGLILIGLRRSSKTRSAL
jgi:hypothetical protein